MVDVFVPVAAPSHKEAKSYLKHFNEWKEDPSFPENCYGHVVRDIVEMIHPSQSHWKSDIYCWLDDKKYYMDEVSVAQSFVRQHLKYPPQNSPDDAYDTYFDEEDKLHKKFDSLVKDALP